MDNFFLGGSTAFGFFTKFNDIISTPGYFTYILKGGPGTGKSTLMRKAAEHFKDSGVEFYYCASDIKSLDAILLKKYNAIIVDGTSPHIFNPELPGIAQCIVDLGEYWDREKLKVHENTIRILFLENKKYHRRAKRLITALMALNDGIYELSYDRLKDSSNLELLESFALDQIKTISNVKKRGCIIYKQLSAITEQGYITLPAEKYKIIGIRDDYYAAGDIILKKIAESLELRGYEIIKSSCDMFSQSITEHILIPDLKIQFSAVNRLNKLNPDKITDCMRFYGKNNFENEFKWDLAFLPSLEKEIGKSIKKALEIHDELESFYITALDTKGLDIKSSQIISELENSFS